MADGTISIDVELNEKEFQAALENMGGIVTSGAESMIKSVDDLSGSFTVLPGTVNAVLKTIPQIIYGAINRITAYNPLMSKAGEDLFMSLTGKMPGIVQYIEKQVPGITGKIIEKITGFIPDMAAAGNEFFTSIVSDMPEIISEIEETVPEIAERITDTIKKDIPSMSETGFDLFAALAGDLPSVIDEISKAPEDIVNALIGVFDNLMRQFNGVGVNIVMGVWAGISSMATWLSSQVSGFFQGIVGGITSFLGISSPSKLFKDKIGRDIALGISAGISGEMPYIIEDTKKYMTMLTDAANQSAQINFSAGGALSAASNLRSAAPQFYDGNQQKVNPESPVSRNEIIVTLEPTGDMRGFFEYISMGVKRADYLNGV